MVAVIRPPWDAPNLVWFVLGFFSSFITISKKKITMLIKDKGIMCTLCHLQMKICHSIFYFYIFINSIYLSAQITQLNKLLTSTSFGRVSHLSYQQQNRFYFSSLQVHFLTGSEVWNRMHLKRTHFNPRTFLDFLFFPLAKLILTYVTVWK